MNAVPLLGVILVGIDGHRWINCITSLDVAVCVQSAVNAINTAGSSFMTCGHPAHSSCH